MIFTLGFLGAISGQISPGELTTAHSNLEGMSNCTKCHEIGDKVHDDKCLDCHKEIKELVFLKKGYHSNKAVSSKNCIQCHSEHHGRNFQIVRFDESNFDHSKTGHKLSGKHTFLKCEKCHKGDFITNDELKKKPKTFLGLDKKCANCHTDFHKGELSNDCASCHNEESFRPAPGFDHNKAKYQLTGAHKTINCDKCHPVKGENENKVQSFTKTEFSQCTSCHEDIHKNKFGQNCTSCHSTTSFRKIVNKEDFDHSKTDFVLMGKHQKTDCRQCHVTSMTVRLRHDQCYNCHSDFHKGEMDRNGLRVDCIACHNEKGFIPSTYTLQQHNSIGFLLEGSHLAVPCEDCHKTNTEWKFDILSTRCIDCHKNVHGSSISSKFIGNDECIKCHTVESWDNVTFNHSTTDFILDGKHKNVACRQCHIKTTFSGKIIHLFKDLSSKCSTCHDDKHMGQFTEEGSTVCTNCHNTESWKIQNFDHGKTKFALTGKHENVTCSKCHKEVENEKGKFIKYKIESFKCADCHS
ncbi:MAG: cytochrome C [Bacteroidetes bacterium]|nr:cytochrome C [Bacteroidota bacterium]